jgi:hypothetical protein
MLVKLIKIILKTRTSPYILQQAKSPFNLYRQICIRAYDGDQRPDRTGLCTRESGASLWSNLCAIFPNVRVQPSSKPLVIAFLCRLTKTLGFDTTITLLLAA